MTLAGGTRLGPYEIVGPLGAGGMGEVYRAHDERLSRNVALKVLPGELADDKGRLERFATEARAASSLNHPNIVTIYDIGSSDSFAYIAMELVEGRTLREVLQAGSIALRRVLSITAQIADGLAKAHAAGIVHRDLKPENLMVTRDGFVKILDFGLAKLVPGGFEVSDGSRLPTITRGTEPGTVLGTIGYMSPEQASGHPVDFRSDQFSFGAILYEMASGKRAFDRSTAVQTLSAIIQEEPEPLAAAAPKTPANLAWIAERCLAKDPEERYASTKDLARDLAGLRDHASGIAVSGIGQQPAPRRFRPSRALFAGAVSAGIVLAALTFFAGRRIQARRDRETPPPATQTLTFRRGFLTGARFAPDGETIVYSAAWDGKPSEIFTTRVGSTESRPLGIFPAGILAISSTGEMAISLGCQNRWEPCFGTLARVPLAGGTPREILDHVGSADWSPDGKELAAIHAVEGGDRIEYPIGKVLYQSAGFLTFLRVSPDGNRVAFLEHPQGDDQLGNVCVVDRSGHKKNLTGELRHLLYTLWSPTGKEVFFSCDHGDGVETDGALLAGGVHTTPWIAGLDDISRNGVALDAGQYRNTRGDILALAPGGSRESNLSWLSGSHAAALSRDGRTLLLYEYTWKRADAQDFQTFLRRTDGSAPKFLGEGKALALSPDEKWALVTRSSPSPHLTLLPTGVGEPRDLPAGAAVQYHWASFFPDGRRILIAAQEKGKPPRSYIQDLAGGPPHPFAEEGMRATLVSPDGTEIAGTTLEGLQLIYRADGEGRARAILGAEPGDFLVQWSADGKSMLVRGEEERPLTLYRIDLASGQRERWKELAPSDMTGLVEFGTGPMGVRVTPDFRFYAYNFYNDLESLRSIELGKLWWK